MSDFLRDHFVIIPVEIPAPRPKPAHESFTREPDGSTSCNDCAWTYPPPERAGMRQIDGPVMRSHRRHEHGEEHYTPGVCDA